MAFAPTPLCCGTFSLMFGVELICTVHLIAIISIISTVSSVEPVVLGNISVSPTVQCLLATWSTIGIPCIVGAGVGALFRLESLLSAYFWYLVTTIGIELVWFVKFLTSGSVCNTLAPHQVQRLGTAFVCGISDSFVVLWGIIALGLSVYFTYIVWSAKQDCVGALWPQLMKYRGSWDASLEPVKMSPPPPQPSMNTGSPLPAGWPESPKASPVQSGWQVAPQAVLPSRGGLHYGSVPVPVPAPDPRLGSARMMSSRPAMPYNSMPSGQPQSYIPSPQWTPVSTSSRLPQEAKSI